MPRVVFLYLSSRTELIWTLGESCHSSGCHLHLLSRVAGWVLQNCGHFAQHLHPELKYRAKVPIDKEVDVPSHFRPCRRLYVTSVLASFSSWSASAFSISDTEVNICPSASPVSKPCCSNWLTVSSTADWRVSTDELELLFHTLRNIKGQTDWKFSFYMTNPCSLSSPPSTDTMTVVEHPPEWGWLCWLYHIHSSQSPQSTDCNCCSYLQEEGTGISPPPYRCNADGYLKDNKKRSVHQSAWKWWKSTFETYYDSQFIMWQPDKWRSGLLQHHPFIVASQICIFLYSLQPTDWYSFPLTETFPPVSVLKQ